MTVDQPFWRPHSTSATGRSIRRRRLARDHPATNTDRGIMVTPLHEVVVECARPLLLVLLLPRTRYGTGSRQLSEECDQLGHELLSAAFWPVEMYEMGRAWNRDEPAGGVRGVCNNALRVFRTGPEIVSGSNHEHRRISEASQSCRPMAK